MSKSSIKAPAEPAVRYQPSREAVAKRDLGHTRVSRAVALFMSILFIVVILAVPLIQHGIGLKQQRASGRSDALSFYSEFKGTPSDISRAMQKADTPFNKILAANSALLKRMQSYQSRLDDTCFLTMHTRAPVQSLLLRLGTGNEKVCIGREGWLFYEPGVSSLTGPAFLDPYQLTRRSRSSSGSLVALQPNPVTAILDFRDQLQRLGIELMLLPTPSKASIHPEKLSGRISGVTTALHNPSYAEFVEAMKSRGIAVLDPGPLMLKMAESTGEMQYLATDTHWTPDAMQNTARALAMMIERDCAELLAESDVVVNSRTPVTVTNSGDIAAMLALPEGDTAYRPEVVTIQQVRDRGNDLWQPAAESPVLLLGDSFANIYSVEAMGWGESAGFAAQLSTALRIPVSQISRNDAGAWATRSMLAQELARGRNPLQGVKLVVWEFAERELAKGDWRIIELPAASTNVSRRANTKHVWHNISGTVSAVSDPPDPNAAYRDYIMQVHLTDISSSGDADATVPESCVINFFGMRHRKILPISRCRNGDKLALKIISYSTVESRYKPLKSGELEDPMLLLENDLYWAIPVAPAAGE